MYCLHLDMGLSDFAVSRAIDELSKTRRSFGAIEIAEYIGCSVSTVKRTLPRLREAGVVVRHGNKRDGYGYTFTGARHANSA